MQHSGRCDEDDKSKETTKEESCDGHAAQDGVDLDVAELFLVYFEDEVVLYRQKR